MDQRKRPLEANVNPLRRNICARLWISALLIATRSGAAQAQVGHLMQEGMNENNSGRTAAKAFEERAKKIDRTPRADWASEEGYLSTMRVQRLSSGELRLCPAGVAFTVEAERAEIGRDDACWQVTSKKKAQLTFHLGPREVPCQISEADTLGLFDVYILEKEVTHEGHCTCRESAADGAPG